MTALLRLHHLHKSFGERLLLDIDLLEVEPRSAYILTGANGSGKSTLLRIIAGLESASVGSTEFDGMKTALTPYPKSMNEQIVYVHQHPIMFSSTVADNIAYGLKARRLPRALIHDRVEEAMHWAGVGHLRNVCPVRLSGGEKQRIALARAKVLQPRLLLLDEPTSSLDGAAREQVIALIPSFLESGGSMIIACHDRDLIGLPDVRRWKLRDGHLQLRKPRWPVIQRA